MISIMINHLDLLRLHYTNNTGQNDHFEQTDSTPFAGQFRLGM